MGGATAEIAGIADRNGEALRAGGRDHMLKHGATKNWLVDPSKRASFTRIRRPNSTDEGSWKRCHKTWCDKWGEKT